jgi:hypothetical protein
MVRTGRLISDTCPEGVKEEEELPHYRQHVHVA